MLRKECNGIQWLEFELLANEPQITHGVFLRHGGHSSEPFASLNLADNVGDHPEHLTRNRAAVCNVLNIMQLAWSRQCHGKNINIVANDTSSIPDGDALVTSKSGVGLIITHADCQATIIYDPIHHAVANVHAGWRGSIQNIYAETIRKMRSIYHSKPENLLVCISPSLGPSDAEFVNYRKELPEQFWEYQVRPNYFDFWQISKQQLQQSGVLPHHIEIASISTYSQPNDYFSYRRQNITGRNGTIVALKRQ